MDGNKPQVLTEDDVHEVYSELWTIKANYYQLGMMLGLPPGELQTIRLANSQNIAQAFTEVLLMWLKQLHNVEKHGRPTWQRLVEAVASPSGGNDCALAKKIAKKHLMASASGSANHPCDYSANSVTQPIADILPHNTPQHVAAGFGFPSTGAAGYATHPTGLMSPQFVHNQPSFRPTSVGFPMRGGAAPFPAFNRYHNPYYHHVYQPTHMMMAPHMYNWQQGGHVYYNFSQGYNQYAPHYNPTVHTAGPENDQAPPSKKCKRAPSAQPPIGQIPLSTDIMQQLDHWWKKLAASYLAEESKSDAWPPLKIVNFVQLALVKQERRARHLNLRTIMNDIDEIYAHKINVTYDDLFQNLKYSSLLLIEGRPGSGKTTLLVRISCDWAKGKIIKSKLIIFVRLRYLDKTKEIYLSELLRVACCALSPEDIHSLSSYIEGRLGEDVVFVLDGFDEYGVGADEDNFICNLISGKVFSRSTVILSSRPAATQGFRQIATQWIEVVGFMKEQVMQYVHTYYEHDKERYSA